MSRRWPSAVAAKARQQFEADWAKTHDTPPRYHSDIMRENGWLCAACDGLTPTGKLMLPSSDRSLCSCHPATMDAESAALDASRQGNPPPVASESRNGEEHGSVAPRNNSRSINDQPLLNQHIVRTERYSEIPQGEAPMTQPSADTQALAQLDPGALTFELEELRRRPLSIQVVNEAKEWDSRAKAYLDQAEKSEVRSKINELFRQHKFWLSKFNAAVEPIQSGRRFCAQIFSRWEMERKRKADEERRAREEAARKEQERQRIEEAAHLSAQGHEEEAIAHLESPLPPVALPEAKDAPGKVQGVTTIEVFKFRELAEPALVVAWLQKHPEEIIALFEPKAGELKRRMTAAKGLWDFPATFTKEIETRNRG